MSRLTIRLSALLCLSLSLPALAETPRMCPQPGLGDGLPALGADGDNDPIVADADRADFDPSGIGTLLGTVRLRKGGKEFSAPIVKYDENHNLISVRSPSLLRSRNILIGSEQADFDLNAESGMFMDTRFTLPLKGGRGEAGQIVLNGDRTAAMSTVSYTTCSPGDEAWVLRASNITVDYDEGYGTATHARLWLGDVPIFYSPWLRFPTDNRRRTGFLFPTIAQTANTGTDLQIPYYVNLAPNYDWLFTPHIMSRRGIQLKNDVRYLFEDNVGGVRFDFLNNDETNGQQRHYTDIEHKSQITEGLVAQLHFANVSDPTYFEDLSGSLLSSAQSFLDRRLNLSYVSPGFYSVTALFQSYQTLDQSILPVNSPYRRLPQIRLRTTPWGNFYNTSLGFDSEYTYFSRPGTLEGQRLDLNPYLRNAVDRKTWYAVSQLDLHYTRYALNGTTVSQASDPDRAVPTLSVEGGLRFERETEGGRLQTLEPRLFYLYTPYVDQNALPVFDTTLADFDAIEIFSRNRYLGIDRISDANHIAGALTSRLLDPDSGIVRMTATIGQIYRITAPRVTLPIAGYVPPPNGSTDTIGSVEYRLSRFWASALSAQWSPGEKRFTRGNFGVYYNDLAGTRFGLAYRYRDGLLEQVDANGAIPINEQWRLSARWRFSLADQQSLESSAGVEYDTCCWAVRTAYRRYLRNSQGDYENGIYLQLELKGLTRFRSGDEQGLLPLLQDPVL